MLKVALTGGIGSGKSTIARYFHQLGVPIVDMDKIVKELTKANTEITQQIIAHIGHTIVTPENSHAIDRSKLREHIQTNPQEKQWLENLIHPAVRQIAHAEIAQISTPYVIIEIPLLSKKTPDSLYDRVLLVCSKKNNRNTRIQQRDHICENEATQRIQTQYIQEQQQLADDIIINDANLTTLKEKVTNFHSCYLRMSAAKEENISKSSD